MKTVLCAAVLVVLFSTGVSPVFAMSEEPTVYVVKKGDTLWGLSDRFIKDPGYWPNLWARNPVITNPHVITPGQKMLIYPDRIVVEGDTTAAIAEAPLAAPVPADVAVPERRFTVSGGAGFLLEKDIKPSGYIISTHQNRQIVGEDDIVYTDIGSAHGARVGDRYSIFKKMEMVSHPVTNFILGYRVIPLGTLQLSELEDNVSKALITNSFIEISAGSYLMPYRDRKREVTLKSSDREMTGYIVETQTGNKIIAAGDIAYLDLGRAQGLAAGNMLYVVRDVVPDQQHVTGRIEKLPVEVLGAIVVVETAENTSTALVVKSIDTIYRGDRVELKKSR